MHRTGIPLTLAALILTGLVFALYPELDLMAARLFLSDGRFIEITPLGETLREIGHITPILIMVGAALAYLLGRAGFKRVPAPSGRAVLFMAVVLAIGPGLLVNAVLKNNSHRPRPVQTQELGGPWEFRPWYRFDGQCIRNCSFVSGEGASAFWTLAPAIITPPAVRPLAVAGALVFGTSVAGLRMAFGGHYLSDSLFSALLTILLVLVMRPLFFGRGSPEKSSPDLRRPDAPL